MKKLIFIGILICLVVVAGTYYIFEKEQPTNDLADTSNSSSSITAQQTEETIENQSIASNDNCSTDNVHQIYQMGETILINDFNITINSMTKSKALEDFSKDKINYLKDVRIDENSLIINEFSYIFMSITYENTLSTPVDFYLNSCYLIAYDDNPDIIKMQGELRSFDKIVDVNEKSAFCFSFKENEKQTFNVLYIAKDDILESSNLAILINNSKETKFEDPYRLISLHY